MESKTKQNPNEENLNDLQLRAKSQYIYAWAGAIVVAILGTVTIVVLFDRLGLQNVFLLGSATVFGVAILLISAADMKANDRGYSRHRDEQKTMEMLAERYKKKNGEQNQSSMPEMPSSGPVHSSEQKAK